MFAFRVMDWWFCSCTGTVAGWYFWAAADGYKPLWRNATSAGCSIRNVIWYVFYSEVLLFGMKN